MVNSFQLSKKKEGLNGLRDFTKIKPPKYKNIL